MRKDKVMQAQLKKLLRDPLASIDESHVTALAQDKLLEEASSTTAEAIDNAIHVDTGLQYVQQVWLNWVKYRK